jgi:putative ABC transport system permease protein
MALLRQIGAVVRLNIVSLPERRWASLSAIGAVALVVLVLLGALALSNGFGQILRNSGSSGIAIVTQKGAVGESNSVIPRDQQDLLAGAPGIALDPAGDRILSRELYIIVDGMKRGTDQRANLALRGVEGNALGARDNVALVAGRMFRPGSREIVVGSAVAESFDGFGLGQVRRIGADDWTIVGTFSAGGGIFESELWADSAVVQSLFRRGTSVQTMRARLDGPQGLATLRAWMKNDSRIDLNVRSERAYYREQAAASTALIKGAGIPLALIMAFGALAGALNTMYASVAARSGEIATLRRIGFSRLATFAGTLAESLVLAAIGALIGMILGFILFDGRTASSLGANFTHTVFELKLSGPQLAAAAIWAAVLGLLGGIFPAWRAARQPILDIDCD